MPGRWNDQHSWPVLVGVASSSGASRLQQAVSFGSSSPEGSGPVPWFCGLLLDLHVAVLILGCTPTVNVELKRAAQDDDPVRSSFN